MKNNQCTEECSHGCQGHCKTSKSTIYVSIKEFLENGGILSKGRDIFIPHEFGYEFDSIGQFIKHEENLTYVSNARYESFPIIDAHVQIEVTPVYK